MQTTSPSWKVFASQELVEQQLESGLPYLEFLRVPTLSCGIYSLPAGAKDLQSPHDEDEVYYVISGRARLRVDDEERVVGAGSVLYVGATSGHSFVEIEEDTTLLVFFASGGPSAG
ncbi:MAG: cupin domain-containing protein [Myxococcota bacterium]|nr:cupin domain-containing protein [Myxococcota bacterium]